MNTEQHAHDVARQWLSLTPEQQEEIRRQNLKVQRLIDALKEKEEGQWN